MTRFFSRIRQSLGNFSSREQGGLSLETVLIFPVFVWTITMTYTFFDGFRESTSNLKAAFTISDLISREGENEITDDYAASMYLLFNRMVSNNSPLKMRLSVIQYVAADQNTGTDESYRVEWSTACGFAGRWTNDNIDPLVEKLPEMADLDTLIIVETSKDYVPLLNTNWLTEGQVFENFVFTRPRFVPIVRGDVSDDFCQQDAPVAVNPGA